MNSSAFKPIVLRLSKTLIIEQIVTSFRQLMSEEMEYNGFKIQAEIDGEIALKAQEKEFLLRLPLSLKMYKPEGLFTLEANGKLYFDFKIQVQIEKDFSLSTNSELMDHEWLVDPKVKMGILNIPIESLADYALDKTKERLLDHVDEMIHKNLDFHQLMNQQFQTLYQGIPIPGDLHFYASFNLNEVHMSYFIDSETYISVEIGFRGKLKVQDQIHQLDDYTIPCFEWKSEVISSDHNQLDLNLTYDVLKPIILNQITNLDMGGQQIQVTDLNINYDESLKLDFQLTKPIEANLEIFGDITLENGCILIEDENVNLKAKNIFHKLGAPVISKIIESRLENYFPLDINSILEVHTNDLNQSVKGSEAIKIKLEAQPIKLESLLLKPKGLQAMLNTEQLDLQIAINQLSSSKEA